MLTMDATACEKSSMSDVRKLIDLFNSYTNEVASLTPTPPPKPTPKAIKRRSARISDISRNSSEGDWTDPRHWSPLAVTTPPRPSTSREREYCDYDGSNTPRSSIDRSSTIRASLIKSIVATRAREMVRPHTAHTSWSEAESRHPAKKPGHTGQNSYVPFSDDLPDPSTLAPSVSSPWVTESMDALPFDLPPKPRWMESVERLSSVQPAVRKNWNVVNGQLRSKLRAVERLPHMEED